MSSTTLRSIGGILVAAGVGSSLLTKSGAAVAATATVKGGAKAVLSSLKSQPATIAASSASVAAVGAVALAIAFAPTETVAATTQVHESAPVIQAAPLAETAAPVTPPEPVAPEPVPAEPAPAAASIEPFTPVAVGAGEDVCVGSWNALGAASGMKLSAIPVSGDGSSGEPAGAFWTVVTAAGNQVGFDSAELLNQCGPSWSTW